MNGEYIFIQINQEFKLSDFKFNVRIFEFYYNKIYNLEFGCL